MNTGYKTIAVHVNESQQTLSRVQFAAGLARHFDAHLVGVAASGLGAPIYFGELAAIVPSYLEVLEDRAKTALALFEAEASKEGVHSFEKSMIPEEPGNALALQARYSDLLIIGQDNPDDQVTAQAPAISDFLVLNSAVPVLVIPHADGLSGPINRVLVAWDGSQGATRAVHGALPLLKKAALVQVAVFDTENKLGRHGEEPGADIALFLARHGVKVEVYRQPAEKGLDAGNAILSHAADFGADLLVMGAYGHSRLRQVVLGGTTRTILASMTMPVLMSH